ncbi:MAG TPA: nuclear transport factor 2 family protein [Luteibacter sp.]|uniref:nuclear transport factor 2 family protein n=1 Tax=Luteibacter sp. TaxID=1886636 RepID=UPI002CAAB7ED|nr:nuclear transport factor 2 family protein [Luteibacter sp.]HVI56341.1 nuclear transport factor 2 family protein [Luteibacter sp.]
MSSLHPNIAMLADVYDDLRQIDRYADDDIVLHLAQRSGSAGPTLAPLRGKAAVLKQMHALLRDSADTLTMQVESIVANDYFGAVLGSIRARRDDSEIAMPFCGLWRFRDGRILEHWENAYDIEALDAFMQGKGPDRHEWVRPSRAVERRK